MATGSHGTSEVSRLIRVVWIAAHIVLWGSLALLLLLFISASIYVAGYMILSAL